MMKPDETSNPDNNAAQNEADRQKSAEHHRKGHPVSPDEHRDSHGRFEKETGAPATPASPGTGPQATSPAAPPPSTNPNAAGATTPSAPGSGAVTPPPENTDPS